MVRTFQLALAATQKRLSDVYGGSSGILDPKTDIPYRYLVLQAEAAAAYLGSDPATLSTTTYGNKVDNTNTGQGCILGAFDAGPIRLSDLYALGAGSTLHILGIPF
jgi:hypothetical protein